MGNLQTPISVQKLRTALHAKAKGRAEDAMDAMRGMMEKLKLTVNDDKTPLCQIPQKRFDFLGYTFERCYSQKTGRAYIGTRPSPRSVKRMVENII
ncbi:MAG: hypothetical protein ABTS16_12185 [Candidatus Accumulibacter phosphatis]|uniref:hypothetical protein n=1 Tax=Candidatus Accumulibacter contiguus TaxID=2954381 RepID=UPI00145E7DF4|nr:hypothetical protein [Candidatus Accumulibacter contiguus]